MTRSLNILKVGASYLFSRASGKTLHWGLPAAVSIEPLNRCNLRCPECPAGNGSMTRPQGTMSPPLFEEILTQLSPALAYLTLYFQGEPYMHPGFLDMVASAKARKIYVSTSTNGHFLDHGTAAATVRSGLDKLIVSLDGPDQESYSAYRAGGNLEKVIEGLKNLAKAKDASGSRKPKTVIQCLLLSTTQHRQGEIRKLAREVKADKVEFKTAQFYDLVNGSPLMPEEKYSRYRATGQQGTQSPSQRVTSPHHHTATSPHFVLKNNLRNACFRMWSSCVITWDGLVVPCCFDKDGEHIMGDLKKQRFEEIWNGERYRAFRDHILHNRKSIDICRNCTQRF